MTRIRLNPLSRKTISAMTNPNLLHGALEQARPGERTRLLWRIDELNEKTYLLVVSEKPINSQNIIDQFGYPGESAETRDYETMLKRITENSLWQFKLCANPVLIQSTKNSNTKRGKVKGLNSYKERMDWLLKKQKDFGFSVNLDKTGIVSSRFLSFKKAGNNSPVSLTECVFTGILKVTDVELFRKALCEGIGKGKAYGMGLLTIVPVYE